MDTNYRAIDKIHSFLWKIKVWTQENIRYIKYYQRIKDNKKLKDKYAGHRCFIIGNGPSLTIDDLNTLKKQHEITFAANKIYQLFDQTDWRPDYYGMCDRTLYNNNKEQINKLNLEKIIPLDMLNQNIDGEKVHVFSRVPFQIFRKRPRFTPNMKRRLNEGGTITFFLLQIAVYLGFQEIYMIGIDFSFSYGIGIDGKYFEDKSIKNHFIDDKKKLDTMPNLQYNLRAYEAAKSYAEKNNLKIYNATRGGKLEVFPRVDFDTLFMETGNGK